MQAPYSGTGLIAIERDKVYAFKWFNTQLTSTVETIKIPENFEGSGYVNVSFIRDWNSDEIYTSPLSYAVKPFQVIPNERKLKIDLNVPELVRPGENLAIQYQTNKSAKIIVYAVDEGILQVADYVTPEPLAYYFSKESLQVETRQIVDQILPRYVAEWEISAIGGDDGQSAISKNLNPFKRKLEKPIVYWSGVIDADQTVRTLNYLVPDYFNGSLRVMAVAAGDENVGSSEKKILSQDNYILTP